jgi:Uma2 family endonuclease
MKSNAALIAETTFISAETFTQKAFKRWVERRPMEDVNRYELANGRIMMIPPAGWGHAETEVRVIRMLADFVDQRDLGRVFGSSAGYDLPSGDTLEPDGSFISHERWAQGPQVGRGQFLRIVPTLAVEIVSASTARRDRIEKKRLYEKNGVEEYWVVDPGRREVTVFHLRGGRYDTGKRFRAGEKLRSRVLPGFELLVGSLFV